MPYQCTLSNEVVNYDWDFKGSDTQYATHGMHTYLAAMVPALAKRLVEKYVPENGKLLDPFCGGGAVVVEGVLKDIPSSGIDINPLAVLITKAKTHKLDEQQLNHTLNEVYESALNYNGPELTFPEQYKIDYWFKDYMYKPLTGLKYAIDSIKSENVRTFFEVVFSATIRDVSLTYRNEQRLRRFVPKDLEKFNPNVFEKFLLRANDSIRRNKLLPKGSSAEVIHGSNLDMPFKDKEFTNIICSPPYGDERNGVPYSQFSKNMLIWLGYKREDLLNLKKLSLGGILESEINFDSPYLEKKLKVFTKEQSINEAISFYNDYYKALSEMKRVTTQYISIVVGNRTLNGQVVDNGKITIELMESLGIKLHSEFRRTLPHKRLPKMGTNCGAQINEEDILTFSVR